MADRGWETDGWEQTLSPFSGYSLLQCNHLLGSRFICSAMLDIEITARFDLPGPIIVYSITLFGSVRFDILVFHLYHCSKYVLLSTCIFVLNIFASHVNVCFTYLCVHAACISLLSTCICLVRTYIYFPHVSVLFHPYQRLPHRSAFPHVYLLSR